MGRLIDADELMDVILRSKKLNSECVLEENAIDTYDNGQQETFELAIKMLDKQPTAYDVDKVVEELRERSREYNSGVRLHGKPEEMITDEAIEIVKRGGVSDDVCEWKLEDEEANLYVTKCQQRHLIFEGTPKDNGYKHCPYCGKKIKVVDNDK